jgi:hypothetical protein
MSKQEAVNTAVGNYLSYLIYGDLRCLQQATHWFLYASMVPDQIRFSLR